VVASSGAVEIMLAMGLEDRIVASCWVKEVWAPLEEAFDKFPHFDKYPNHTEMFDLDPDFIYATYSSAFDLSRINYTDALGIEACDLVIPSNVYGENKTYCREELHDAGINTYLSSGYCELVEHRPEEPGVADLFQEIWEVGAIFDAKDEARRIVSNIEDDFALAQSISKSNELFEPLRVLWFDMYNGTSNPTPDDPQPYVGACCGGPQIIIREAGAVNVFEDKGVEDRRMWDYATLDEMAETDPDVIVLVELSTETAAEKLSVLCTDERTKGMRAVKERAFVVVPFAATNLGVRLGAMVYNFAEAMGALSRGKSLSALQFTTDEETAELSSTSGARVWTSLPEHGGIDLEEICPGAPRVIEISDAAEESPEELAAKVTELEREKLSLREENDKRVSELEKERESLKAEIESLTTADVVSVKAAESGAAKLGAFVVALTGFAASEVLLALW